MLLINEISIAYRGIKTLNKLSAQAYENDFICIIGHNGAGKSTLIKALEGRIKLHEGAIILDNIDISHYSRLQRAMLISTLHQNIALGSISNMTVEENLALALLKGKQVTFNSGLSLIHNEPWLLQRWQELFPHKNILKEKVSNLSGGERQMLAFLIATAVPPKLLLLDEPTAALDPAAADRMMKFIHSFARAQKLITIMVTHDLDAALAHGNKIWVIKHGVVAHAIDLAQRQISAAELKLML